MLTSLAEGQVGGRNGSFCSPQDTNKFPLGKPEWTYYIKEKNVYMLFTQILYSIDIN